MAQLFEALRRFFAPWQYSNSSKTEEFDIRLNNSIKRPPIPVVERAIVKVYDLHKKGVPKDSDQWFLVVSEQELGLSMKAGFTKVYGLKLVLGHQV